MMGGGNWYTELVKETFVDEICFGLGKWLSSEAGLHHTSLLNIALCLSHRVLSANRCLTTASATRRTASQLVTLIFDLNVIPVGNKRMLDII